MGAGQDPSWPWQWDLAPVTLLHLREWGSACQGTGPGAAGGTDSTPLPPPLARTFLAALCALGEPPAHLTWRQKQ